MSNNIKAIIFDMDGVLIDAKEWHYEALNRALSLFGYNINRYEHLVTYDGLPTKKKLEMLSLERGLPRALHGFLNELKQIYTLEIVNLKCKPVFQKEFALARFKEMGIRMGVCSNSVKNSIEIMLEKSNLLHYFDFILSNQDVKRPKPDPEIYLKAIASLKLLPTECLIVEDNDHGIQSARASGAHVLEVSDVKEVNFDNINNRIKTLSIRKAA